jgi:hypothetical protein
LKISGVPVDPEGTNMSYSQPDDIVTIALHLADGTFVSGEIRCWDNDPLASKPGRVRLCLEFQGRSLQAGAENAFHAFCALRHQLEADKIRPCCYGASKNVYPSGMCLDMGQGYVAYKLSLGDHARKANLVNIFDTGEDVDPATVEEQATFYQQWLASLPGASST